MAQATLFAATELSGWLRQPVDDASAVIVESVVWGWLKPVLKISERPDPVSEELKAWALELGGIAYSNPEGLAAYALESERSTYSDTRIDTILRRVAGGGAPSSTDGAPQGSFPPAPEWPDPILGRWW